MRWTAKDASYAGVVFVRFAANGYARERRRVYTAKRELDCGKCGGKIAVGEDFSPGAIGHPTCVRCYPWVNNNDY